MSADDETPPPGATRPDIPAAPVPPEAATGPSSGMSAEAWNEAAAAIPEEWVKAAEGHYSMHGAGLIRNILAGVAPLIRAAERARIRRGVLARELILQHPEDGDRVAVLTLDMEQIIGAEDGSDG